ncbi:pyrin-like [Lampris incognitus]|uniref:pyrin-like n=1 Tax=Lampris incognitus TaxID=2546036 RepID=UPI0024B4F787|nr:pyrin-like [Lampris incognitus]
MDEKTVRWRNQRPTTTTNKGDQRFNDEPYVLGGIQRCCQAYWKVSVEGKDDWLLGAALPDVDRKGQLLLSPEKGFWVIILANGTNLTAMNDCEEVLDKSMPKIVGIHVDYVKKSVTFYDEGEDDRSQIYKFHNGPKIDEWVSPIFSPWNNDEKPIAILPILNRNENS